MTSFIVVNFNTAKLTRDCVTSILTNTVESQREIIVIDNASADDGVVLLKKEFGSQIKLIANSVNGGFAAANNIGARIASGDFLFFLNSDTIIESNIVSHLELLFKNNHKLGVVAPRLRLANGQPQLFAYGRFPNLVSVVFNKIWSLRFLKKTGQFMPVDWVSGAALIIRKEIFESIGGWDEKYFLYFEDVDLCWQVKKLEFEIGVFNEVSVIHFGGRSLAQDVLRKRRYYASQEYFFQKNYGLMSANILKLIRWPYRLIKN